MINIKTTGTCKIMFLIFASITISKNKCLIWLMFKKSHIILQVFKTGDQKVMRHPNNSTFSTVILVSRLNKSYEALEYGFEADAFTDLTGGLAEWYNPAELKEHDFYLIRAAYQCGAVIGCLSVVSV